MKLPVALRISLVVLLAGLLPSFLSLGAHLVLAEQPCVLEPLHNFLESAGSCIALGVALLLLLRVWYEPQASHLLWLVAGLTAMGLLDAAHALVPFGLVWSWLRHGATLAGGLFFGLVWLPLPGFAARRKAACVLAVGALAAAAAVLLWFGQRWLPAPWNGTDYTFAVKAANALGGLGFLAAAHFFLRRYAAQPQSAHLLFASFSLLFSTAALLFGFSRVWAADWWLWHVFRLLAYGLVFLSAFASVRILYRTLTLQAGQLEHLVQARTAELHQATECFRSVLEHSLDVAYRRNLQLDRYDYLSPVVEQVLGFSVQEMNAMPYAQLLARIHPEDRPPMAQAVEQASQTGAGRFEYRWRRKDGQWRWMADFVRVVKAADGRPCFLSGVVRDVTEQKQAQEALRLAHQRLEYHLQNTPLAVIEFDPELRVSAWSAGARRMFGWDSAEVLGLPMWQIPWICPEDRPQVEKVSLALTSGQTLRSVSPNRNRRKDGSVIWCEWYNSSLTDAAGQMRSIQSLVLDVTERKAFQEELERLVAERTAKLQEMLAELQHISYAIVHDMRAPLRAMHGFAEMLEEECAPSLQPLQQAYLARIRTATRRLDLQITDALHYTKAVLQELPMAPVDLGRLLPEIIQTYPNLHQADIALEGHLPVVLGNESLLTQCFSNLLGNAVKFVAPGVRPRVRVWAETVHWPLSTVPQSAPASRITHHASRLAEAVPDSTLHAPHVRVCVQDNGIGIPQQAHARLFQMFQRMTTTYEGTGIGLAIVRKVVERMGGRVGVESEPGQGSRFWVDLQVAPETERFRPERQQTG